MFPCEQAIRSRNTSAVSSVFNFHSVRLFMFCFSFISAEDQKQQETFDAIAFAHKKRSDAIAIVRFFLDFVRLIEFSGGSHKTANARSEYATCIRFESRYLCHSFSASMTVPKQNKDTEI